MADPKNPPPPEDSGKIKNIKNKLKDKDKGLEIIPSRDALHKPKKRRD